MTDERMRRHTLTGFPDAAVHLLLSFEEDRQQIAADHGISAIELKGLFRIATAGSLTPKHLAEQLSMTNGAITGLSTRLVAAGLLQRVAHPNDRRSLYLELTEAGHRAMAAIHADFNEMVSDATTGITVDELEVTVETLRRVTTALRARLRRDLD